jgi:hypothetical protein
MPLEQRTSAASKQRSQLQYSAQCTNCASVGASAIHLIYKKSDLITYFKLSYHHSPAHSAVHSIAYQHPLSSETRQNITTDHSGSKLPMMIVMIDCGCLDVCCVVWSVCSAAGASR